MIQPFVFIRAAVLSAAFCAAGTVLCGCGLPGVQPGLLTGEAHVTGTVLGGQQPVSGSTLQLYAVGATGYGSASTALLSAVSSDTSGSFDITGRYTCPSASTLVYLAATGGNPGVTGSNNNGAIALAAVLGPCGNLSASTHIVINEVTSVAAAWTLAPFASGLASVGSSSTNGAGMANAFSMAADLASSDRGQSPGDAPAGSSVPNAEINTLANILAACINSIGPSSPACGNLFANTTVNSTAPTNTFAAALNIAKYPGVNVAALYNISTSTGPFQPSLSSTPNDWTIAVSFPVVSSAASDMAVDAAGNLWVLNTTALYELTPAGALLGTYVSMAGTRVALDPSGNIWVGTTGAASTMTLKKLPANLGAAVTYTYSSADDLAPTYTFTGLAFDGFGNAWYTCAYCFGVSESNAAGAYVGSFSLANTFHATTVSIDPSENVWVGNMDSAKVDIFTQGGGYFGASPYPCPGSGSTPVFITNDGSGNGWMLGCGGLTRMSSTGTATTLNSVMAGSNGGLNGSTGISIDGAGNAWVSNATSGGVTEANTAAAPVSPSTGYLSNQLASPQGIAIDGSGTVWVRNGSRATVTAFVGAAVPAVAPLALGVKNGTLGSRP